MSIKTNDKDPIVILPPQEPLEVAVEIPKKFKKLGPSDFKFSNTGEQDEMGDEIFDISVNNQHVVTCSIAAFNKARAGLSV
jgi:hypothetical protein